MNSADTMAIIAGVNLAVWVALGLWAAYLRIRRWHIPDALVAAAIVGTIAAAFGGFITSFGYRKDISVDLTQAIGSGWRAAMLIAGLYGVAGAIRAARAKR